MQIRAERQPFLFPPHFPQVSSLLSAPAPPPCPAPAPPPASAGGSSELTGPVEWRGEGVWAPCMHMGFKRPWALAASCCALHLVWVWLIPMCSQMAPLSLGTPVAILLWPWVEVEGSLWLCCVGRDKGTPLSHLGLFPLPLPLPQVGSHPVL